MNIFIIGLGLIGGSLAKSLKGFKNADIFAVNRTRKYLDMAENDGVIKKGYTIDDTAALACADVIILCLYPAMNVDFIRKNKKYLKSGAVVTDVSGVKTFLNDEMKKLLPPDVDFIGGHPMAGREVTSYENSTADLFKKASYIIVPSENSKPENITLIEDIAHFVGADVIRTSPENHDEIIAYTSQLMHAAAVALCNIPTIEKSSGYGGGSIRDITRIANINETLWSELFLENAPALLKSIDNMQQSLSDIREAIANNDEQKLKALMANARSNKLKWL